MIPEKNLGEKKEKPSIPEKRGRRILGLCLGASTITRVLLEATPSGGAPNAKNLRILDAASLPHEGNPKQTIVRALKEVDPDTCDGIIATGRRFRKFVQLTSISEPEAVEAAYRFVKPEDVDCPAIVSAGGETFMVYVLDATGKISTVLTGNKCASGTGEFFLQQLRRMDVRLEEAAKWAAEEKPYHVSGRCSVFCKSDCTHATNKGIPKSRVTAGLCKMMAEKILELMKKVNRRDIMVVGGTAQNRMMISYLKNEIPGLIVPEMAPYFEALGAAVCGAEMEAAPFPGYDRLFSSDASSFDRLPRLSEAETSVTFKIIERDTVQTGDECIFGLDVGSTTTKAVLIRTSDHAILASVYLRTNGDPVGASRNCYREILTQVEKSADPSQIAIIGLGVCGSGRQIAGLHALTDGVINEIIAHCTAAVFFDPEVDTLFEIGGQDAKYTYITNGVPSDYAMNEACSAGTGSFLEESAYETLGVRMEDIAGVALKGSDPPNFNDQCAAFISSDIKNAIHEGIAHEDIVAGLVYSICMNYTNRVKGNRPVGEKVFMQGGVCYNRAVPLAMATLVGKPIIVPPEPGLMGAFGVALEVKRRLKAGLMKEKRFDLRELADRPVSYGKTFTCGGGKEKCDRRCEITMVEVAGEKHPFGGACNRYYNIRQKLSFDTAKLDLVHRRHELVFKEYAEKAPDVKKYGSPKTVAINRSFLHHTYFPLYSTFFTSLGFSLAVPDVPSKKGIDSRGAAFCYPVELAHGFFHTLLTAETPPDFIFLPHFKAIPAADDQHRSEVCPLIQGETYYLQATFREQLAGLKAGGCRVLSPLINLTTGLEAAQKPLMETARLMGVDRNAAAAAFAAALERQNACFREMQTIGRRALEELERHPDRIAVVLFGRPYNAFAEEGHMGIPKKLASRGVMALPLDFLPLDGQASKRHMYWGMGQLIMKGARIVKQHPQLFGTYVTNFSCGPDSFIIGYFRDMMGEKPSLTLELDSHTADAGLETRIEAFLDVVSAYRRLTMSRPHVSTGNGFVPAQTVFNGGTPEIVTSDGEVLPMNHPRVTVMLPSMGRTGSEAIAALFRGAGFNAFAHPPADEAILKKGRGNTSCKECLPLILTTGTLLNYINNGRKPDEVLVYFMATGSGPCRFGQYKIFMEDLIRKQQIRNVSLFSLTSENAYAGMSGDFDKKAWWAIIASDVFEDMRSMILANAVDPKAAMVVWEKAWGKTIKELETQGGLAKADFKRFESCLAEVAGQLGGLPMKQPASKVPVISLVGEIFVRRDGLSRQYLTEHLAGLGFATVCASVTEWLKYTDYLVEKGLSEVKLGVVKKLGLKLKKMFMARYERRCRQILSRSGLICEEAPAVETLIKNAAPYVLPDHLGEAILTVGSAITDIASHACGVIAIGPFGCMPNRMSEAILNEIMEKEVKLATAPEDKTLQKVLENTEALPFLAIESDGSAFPQLINAKLEAFCMQAERLHENMMAAGE